jgi:hypothetical protein
MFARLVAATRVVAVTGVPGSSRRLLAKFKESGWNSASQELISALQSLTLKFCSGAAFKKFFIEHTS